MIETTFVLPLQRKGPAARLRIFTIDRELPMAGRTRRAAAVVGTPPARSRLHPEIRSAR